MFFQLKKFDQISLKVIFVKLHISRFQFWKWKKDNDIILKMRLNKFGNKIT